MLTIKEIARFAFPDTKTRKIRAIDCNCFSPDLIPFTFPKYPRTMALRVKNHSCFLLHHEFVVLHASIIKEVVRFALASTRTHAIPDELWHCDGTLSSSCSAGNASERR